ncbi:MAG: PAS domain-containing protein, partial [Chloroflexaceae bacterium]|nr:PAS domain-containing protein [Chloroflexaceae bacterium]
LTPDRHCPRELEQRYGDQIYRTQPLSLRNDQGQIIAGMIISQNITERTRMEEDLRASEAFLRSIYEGTQSGIFLVDVTPEGDFFFGGLNPAHEQHLGIRSEDIAGKRPEEIPGITAESAAALRANYQRCLAANAPIQYEEQITFNGHPTWWLTQISPMRDDTGRIYRIIGSSLDLTEQKQMHAQLEQAREVAEAASRAKSAFLAHMSHELRTPLNAILGFAQVLEGSVNLNDQEREQMHIINNSGEHLLRLINDVLEVAKIEAGKTEIRKAPFDLHQMLQTLIELFQLQAHQKGLHLRLERTASVPQHIVSDEMRLRQILTNLLSNAVKFTNTGSVVLRVSYTSTMLTCEVQDTGIGMQPEHLARVYEPFMQIASRTDIPGTGLGLTISRHFVQLLGAHCGPVAPKAAAVSSGLPFRLSRISPQQQPQHRIVPLDSHRGNQRIAC